MQVNSRRSLDDVPGIRRERRMEDMYMGKKKISCVKLRAGHTQDARERALPVRTRGFYGAPGAIRLPVFARMIALLTVISLCLSGCGSNKKDKADQKDGDSSAVSGNQSHQAGSGDQGDDNDAADDSAAGGENYVLRDMIESYRYLYGELLELGVVPFATNGTTTGQGGYTDGRYFYQAYIKKIGDELENEDVIVKYDMLTKTVVKESPVLHLSHANDITMNTRTGKLIVSHCIGDWYRISVLDPDTLTVTETKEIETPIGAIAYNEKRDSYVVSSYGNGLYILDANFNPIADYDPSTLVSDLTSQGIGCDDDYIYHVFHMTNEDGHGVSKRYIVVYDWNGNFKTFIRDDAEGEPENISVIGNDIYMAANGGEGGMILYKLKSLIPDPDEDQ